MSSTRLEVPEDGWPVHLLGIMPSCMDRRLNHEIVDAAARAELGLPDCGDGQYASKSYFYLLTSAGGAIPCMFMHAGRVLAENGRQGHYRLQITHIVIPGHTDCAAVKAAKNMRLTRGAKEIMLDYLLLQEEFPGMFVGRPILYLAEVDIHTSLLLPGSLKPYEGQDAWWEKHSGPSKAWLRPSTHRESCLTNTL